MRTPASFHKHPIHPMLVPFPIALWIFSLICDVVYASGMGGEVWASMAFYTMAGGLVGALMAALPGYLDFRSITDRRSRRIGLWHMGINLSIVATYAVNLWLRTGSQTPSTLPISLSVIGLVLLAISGWLGGELVYVRGVAVESHFTVSDVTKEGGRVA